MNLFETGIAAVQKAVATAGQGAGVYRMLNAAGDVLYVGKAKHLANRLTAYTRPLQLSNRLQRMIMEIAAVELIVTKTEHDALVLEASLIKSLKPRYNILLRDDKSYPYIVLTQDHGFPRLTRHRGAKTTQADYYGPFASSQAVNETLDALYRVFQLRNCSDAYFAARMRPCLQYHIKRCTAPCVGKITVADYRRNVEQAQQFLTGRGDQVRTQLVQQMQTASDAQQYERAAAIRDRLKALAKIQAHSQLDVAGIKALDVVALHRVGGRACVQVFFLRYGQNLGNRALFLDGVGDATEAEIMGAFLNQFYAEHMPPAEVAVSHMPDELFLEGVRVFRPTQGAKAQMVKHAVMNAAEALARRQQEAGSQKDLLERLQMMLGLDEAPQRIEVYDNSHLMGQQAYGVMIVAGPEGFQRKHYRKFVIKDGVTPGDDYGMMRQVIERRMGRTLADTRQREGDGAAWQLPDVMLIDGGRGQLSTVQKVLEGLGVDTTQICILGIAKGAGRRPGLETLYRLDGTTLDLAEHDPLFHYLQRLRDEAHRFAIGTHRAARGKTTTQTRLDDVPNIGPRRKMALLRHFGSARAVSEATVDALKTVDGISQNMAQKIYDFFHPKL